MSPEPPDPDPPRAPAHRNGGGLRYRVMLVRLPPGGSAAVQKVLPGGRPVDRRELPMITRITSDHASATETADRLRATGAVVLVTEEHAEDRSSAFCGDHPHRLAPTTCLRCGAPICDRCLLDAQGEEICARCAHKGHSRVRNTRLRQLFVVFLFAVFVYEVVAWVAADEARVDPGSTVRAVLIQLVEPGGLNAPIIRRLNQPDSGAAAGTSLLDIGPWYRRERTRYGGPEQWMKVELRGPWVVEVRPPPLDDPKIPAWRLLYNAWQWPRYFHGIAGDYGIDAGDFGVRAYVIYGGKGDMAADSRGSEKGRIAVSWIPLDEQNPGYAVLTVAHEMGHALGAFDRYSPDSYQALHPEGYVEPFAQPLYPQRFAELMAVDIPTSLRSEREVTSMDEVRIGHRTAAEMGWIAREQADLFYSPPTQGPLDRLPSREVGEIVPARPNHEQPIEGGADLDPVEVLPMPPAPESPASPEAP